MTANNDDVILSGMKLTLAKLAWWVIFILSVFTFPFGVWGDYIQSVQLGQDFYTFQNLFSLCTTIIGMIIMFLMYWKRSSHWMVVVISTCFFAVSSGIWEVGYYVFNHGWGILTPEGMNPAARQMANYFSLPYVILLFSLLFYTILVFPTGRWIRPGVKWFFFAGVLSYAVTHLLAYIYNWGIDPSFYVFMTLALLLQFFRYRTMPNSVQRQQVKWILVFISLIIIIFMLSPFVNSIENRLTVDQYKLIDISFTWAGELIYDGFILALVLSVIRYRLWDIDSLISRALIYSSLTGLLGLIGILSTAILNFFIKQAVGEDSSIWAVVISALPVAVAFNPLRDWLQKVVDRFFKPEEVSFTFIEFSPAVREMLSTEEIINTLASQVRKQLDLDFAKVYLYQASGQLNLINTTSFPNEVSPLALENKQLIKLQSGELIINEDGVPYSLLIPLIVPRAHIPDFLGVIVLGRRLNGKGYSTQILSSLKKLSADSGEAIYLSQISERVKKKIATDAIPA